MLFLSNRVSVAKKLKLSPEASKGKSEMKESAISKSVIAVNTSSASSSGAQNFEFSETGIRQFITVSGGGRTTVKKILEQYKKQMKSIGPNAAARLKEMLLKVFKSYSWVFL